DPEVLAGLDHCIVDRGAFFQRPVQLIGETAGHSDAPDLRPYAVDQGVAEAQELDVPQALARDLFKDLQGGGTSDLEQVVPEPLELDVRRNVARLDMVSRRPP